ncbi:MAG: DUF4362 domain-containing protein [Clostridia bacterium]|nr:DUF4362 domain-containing protein [Clostridia bacterium]
MKKVLLIVMSFILIWGLMACDKGNDKTYTFKGKVVEMYMNNLIVEPLENEDIRRSADKIQVWIGQTPTFHPPIFPEGTLVEIEYDGNVAETYPVQINAITLRTIDEEGNDVIPPISQMESNKITIKNGKNDYDSINVGRIESFIENSKNGNDDEIEVTQYTIEGDPIITTVRYNGTDGTFQTIRDTTQDKFGAPEIIKKEYDNSYRAVLSGEVLSKDGAERSYYAFQLVSEEETVDICMFNY